jgi:hypothetical protein
VPRLALVDGTLWPCWSWENAPGLWAGKYKTTGHGSLIISDESGNIIFVSDPAPGCEHAAAQRVEAPTDPANVAMRAVFERAGWELVGSFTEFDREWLMYAITRRQKHAR